MNIVLKKYKSMSIQTKASIAYTFANLVSKGINIITVPVFTRLMSTYEVGVSTTYTSWYSILYAIVTLSLCSGSLNIAMMDYKDRRSDYQSACLTLSTISGLVFAIFYYFLKNSFNRLTTLDSPIMWMLIISLIINPALDFWYARQRYEFRYKSSVVVTLLVSFLSAGVSIFFVFWAKKSQMQNLGSIKVLSQGVVTTAIAFVFFCLIFVKGKTHIDIKIWKYALGLSLPLIVHTLAKNVLDVSDRLMISSICGKSYAGIYGTIYSLAMISLLVWNAINTSLIPTTFEKLQEKEYTELNSILKPVVILFGGVSILVTLFAPEILLILTTADYYDAVYLIPALSAGVFFTSLYNIYGNLLLFKKKTVNIMLATVIAALVNIGLNFVCIKQFGYVAAAYTTLISFVLLAFCQGVMVRGVFRESVINDKLFGLIACIVAVACLLCNVTYKFTLLRYGLIIALIMVFIFKRKSIIKIIKKR